MKNEYTIINCFVQVDLIVRRGGAVFKYKLSMRLIRLSILSILDSTVIFQILVALTTTVSIQRYRKFNN